MTTTASVRGITSASIGETPIVRIASISSVSFIVPSCAAKAEPDRPATMIAVINTPNSRNVRRPTRLMVNISMPNWRSCTDPCCAITMPIRKLIKPMMPSADTPTTSNRWTTALTRKRLGWRISPQAATRLAPKNPNNPTSVVPALMTASPIWPTTRVKGDTLSGRTAMGSSSAPTASTNRCASPSAPMILASSRFAALCTVHAPIVSIWSTCDRSMASTGPCTPSRRAGRS